MGKWSRTQYDNVLLGKLEQLYTKCRDKPANPLVDSRFRTFIQDLDVNDKAIQACFSNLIHQVHRRQLATSSSYTVDHPIFASLTNVDPIPMTTSPRLESINFAGDPDIWPFERPGDREFGARSPTPMPSRPLPPDTIVPGAWRYSPEPTDPTYTIREQPLPSILAPGSPALSQSAAARERQASTSPQPLSPSQAWLEEYSRIRQDNTGGHPFPTYSSYTTSELPLVRRRRRQEETEDEGAPRRRRRRLEDVIDPAILGTRMERDRRRDGVVFSAFSPDIDSSAELSLYRAPRSPPSRARQ